MNKEPRISKRESTATLRKDALTSSAGRGRSGSNASTTSRPSMMFSSPAKGFGLTRKASTATLSVASVSVTGNGINHSLESAPKDPSTGDGMGKGKGTERARPVRQATRAEDALRSVRTRAPAPPTTATESDLAPLSESPKNISAPLATISDETSSSLNDSASAPSSSRSPKSRSRTSLIPVFRGSPERTKSTTTATTGNVATPQTPTSTSTSSRQANSKFRTPTMPSGFGLTRKASTSSTRSTAAGYKPISSSPLAGHTPSPSTTTTAPAPLPNPAPAPPKLDTGSVSAKPIPTGASPILENAISSSPSGTSWLSAIRGITSSKIAAPGSGQPVPGDASCVPGESSHSAGEFISSPVDKDSPSVDKKSPRTSALEVAPAQPNAKEQGEHPPSPVDSESGLVMVDAPTTPIAGTNANSFQINALAAQHAANSSWAAHTPASWLAWATSMPYPGLPARGQIESGDGGSDVMHIESDEEVLAEDHAPAPIVDEQKAGGGGWGWAAMGLGRQGKANTSSAEGDKGKGKAQRPPIGPEALSVDTVVLALPEGERDVAALPPPSIKPVTQNTLSLNTTALRYALQLPLLGRPKPQLGDLQGVVGGGIDQAANNQPSLAAGGNPSHPKMITTRYSDEHDFVIIETEVDGWILIDTEGTSPTSPFAQGQPGANSWWNYYTGRLNHGPTAPADLAGPSSMGAQDLSSPTQGTRDTDSANSSLFSTVMRPFGRGKDAKLPADGSTESTKPLKTQAELIKEEALARQSPSIVPELPSPVLNTTTKASWVSYFSSKASRSTPVMSDGRGIRQPSEMEVMNVDEEDMGEPIQVHTSSPASSRKVVTSKPASPLTDSPSVKHKASVISQGKKSSSASAKESLPNLVLPTFGDTFYTVPRCAPPRVGALASEASAGSWKLKRRVKNLSTMLFNTIDKGPSVANAEMEEYQRRAAERRRLTNRANFATVEPAVPRASHARGSTRSHSSFGSLAIDDFGQELPRVNSVLGNENVLGDVIGPVRAAVIGVHGWFPGPLVRSVFGEPTGTSVKFASMGVDALRQFAEKHQLELESVTPMPLEGEGTIERRVAKLYDDLLKHPQWLADLHRADVVLVATHSQGSIVSTHLIARLISDGHIRTRTNRQAVNRATVETGVVPPMAPHRVCCLAMCGIHMGPLYSLNSSAFAQPYLQWIESPAARELFEFQNTESEVSQNYVAALSTALDHGTKFVYIASLNDQVVPIYSGTFVAASHPLILRGLFLDGDAYSSSDFLSNLLVLLLRVKNAGLDEQGLVMHLSEATAGSLSGIGHSTAYEDLGPYTLAVRYLFETSEPGDRLGKLTVDAFEARGSRNDYEIPWLLHSVISDGRIGRVFASELAELRESFGEWKPTTGVLRDIQRKLAPIRMSPLRHSVISQDSKL